MLKKSYVSKPSLFPLSVNSKVALPFAQILDVLGISSDSHLVLAFPPKLGAELPAGSVTLLFLNIPTNKAPAHGYDPFSTCVLPVREEFGRKLFQGPHKK